VTSHRDRIVDQFTRQAVPFSTAPGILDEDALSLLVAAAGAGRDDTVLDVACGPGLVVSAFARVVPCEDPADLCVVGDSGAPALLAEDAGDAARWGDDSVAYLTGGRLVVRPVGPGHPRVVAWSGVPPRPRQLTVFPGATEPR